jgi:Tfp pilus assembly protein PilV
MEMEKMLQKKVSASSLIEVIVSMVIISIVFGLSLMIFVNIQSQMDSQIKVRAGIRVRNLATEYLKMDVIKSEVFEDEDFTTTCTLTPFSSNGKLLILQIEAITKDSKVLYKFKKLVRKKGQVE